MYYRSYFRSESPAAITFLGFTTTGERRFRMSSVMAAPMNLRETRFLKIFLTLTFTYGQYVYVLVRNQNHSFGLAEGFLNSHWT